MPLDSAARAPEAVPAAEFYTLRGYQKAANPWEFVASTDTMDRYGDVVVPDGWDLKNFKKNPIALWNHSQASPIGTWKDVRVEGNKLLARLEMLKPGTSSIADMLRGMVEEKVLRAVSVGFIPKEIAPIIDKKGDATGGFRYLKSELLEISLVAVPANPDAISLARSLGAGPRELRLLFAEPGEEAGDASQSMGRAAPSPPPSIRKSITMSLQDRIVAAEAKVSGERDELTRLAAIDDPDEAAIAELTERTETFERLDKSLESLRKAQKAILASARPAGAGANDNRESSNDNAPAVIRYRGEKDPATLLFRAATVLMQSFGQRKSIDDIIRQQHGGAQDLDTVVKAVTNPAMTTVTGWAAELVGQTIGGFVNLLTPNSVFFNLGMPNFTFSNGKIKLPSRASGTNINGDFVAEGAPIPVRQAAFTSTLLEPFKLGVITTFTREMAMLSDPQIEPILRDLMISDTRVTIDTRFLDNNPAVATLRPAGLQNLSTGNTAASSGTTIANIITDVKAAVTAFANNNLGRRLTWIMNTQRVMSLGLLTTSAGTFMWKDELGRGQFMGIPLIASTDVPSSVVYLVDVEALAGGYDSVPQIDVSEQATLHMESSAATVPPTAGTVSPVAYAKGGAPGGTPGTAAFGDFAQPVRSLFQTASVALRLLWDVSWIQRQPGAVYTITGVAW